jgi:hypothetical protein
VRPPARKFAAGTPPQHCSHDPVQWGFRVRSRDCWRDRVALLIRCLRFLFAEFLEARIIPERIKHRIEPEQCGSQRRKLSEKFALLFRRERGDDFLEARIAAERVPEGMQF